MDKLGHVNSCIKKNSNLIIPKESEKQLTNKFAQFARFAQFANCNKDGDLLNTKTIPSEVYENLPKILKKGSSVFNSQREKDVFLTGAIGILSGCFNTVKGLYASEEHYPNLNCFIVGPPGGGKGAMKHSKTLATAIHEEKLCASNGLNEQLLATPSSNDNLKESPQKLLYIPANSSAAAVIRHLSENEESGIICETEADTLSDAFKQDWGGYSDLLRKSYHHETVSSSRKTNREYYELKSPKLSTVLSGTPFQVNTLLKSSENGLFSRMIFYAFDGTEKWRSVAPRPNRLNLSTYFQELSKEVKSIHDHFSKKQYEFELTEQQWKALDNQFESWLDLVTTFIHKDTSSIVKRLGLIQFRIAMIFSILRFLEQDKEGTVINCSDEDFRSAQLLSEVYLDHGLTMFFKLPGESKLQIDNYIKTFYDALPETNLFAREEAIKIGNNEGVKERTVGKYLKRLVDIKYLYQPEYGKYKKN